MPIVVDIFTSIVSPSDLIIDPIFVYDLRNWLINWVDFMSHQNHEAISTGRPFRPSMGPPEMYIHDPECRDRTQGFRSRALNTYLWTTELASNDVQPIIILHNHLPLSSLGNFPTHDTGKVHQSLILISCFSKKIDEYTQNFFLI